STGYTYTFIDAVSGAPHLVYLPPNAPPRYDDDGKPNWEGWSNGTNNNPYPFGSTEELYETKGHHFTNSVNLSYEILKGLTLGGQFGFGYNISDNFSATPNSVRDPNRPGITIARFGKSIAQNKTFESTLTYARNWN